MSVTIKQIKTMEKWSLSQLKKEFWRIFSIYIRIRDKGVCFSCKKSIPDFYDKKGNLVPGWKAAQAGHFITAKNCGLALYFHEKNVHCQCYHCNINLSGNWLEYEKAMIHAYGKDETENIKSLKWTGNTIYSKDDYIQKIIEYKNKCDLME